MAIMPRRKSISARKKPSRWRRLGGWVFHRHVRQLALLAVLVTVAAFAYLHWWGVPGPVRAALLDELGKRGIQVEIGALTYDPWRGTIAEKVRLQLPGREPLTITADEIRLKVAYGPLLKGRAVVEELELVDSVFSCDLHVDDGTIYPLVIKGVNGSFAFDEQRRLWVRDLRARVLSFALQVEGSLLTERPRRPRPEPKPFILQRRWVDWIRRAEKDSTGQPLNVHVWFNGELSHPEDMAVEARMKGRSVEWGKLSLKDAHGRLRYKKGELWIEHLVLESRAGKLQANGWYSTAVKQGGCWLHGDIIPQWLAPLIPKEKEKYLDGWEFKDPVAVDAWAEISGGLAGTTANLRIRSGAFSGRGVAFRGFSGQAQWAAGKLSLSEFIVTREEGNFTASADYERATGHCSFRVESYLNFDQFEPLLPAGKNFFRTFDFAKPPVIRLEGEFVKGQPDSLKAAGSLEAQDFTGNGVPVRSVKCGLEINGPKIRFRDVVGVKNEGRFIGNFLLNTRTHDLTIQAVSDVYPIDVATILGPKSKATVQPYEFSGAPPHNEWNGTVNLKNPRLNDLKIWVKAGKLHWWKMSMENVRALVWIRPRTIEVLDFSCAYHEGTLHANVLVDITRKEPKFGFRADLKRADFRPVTAAAREARAVMRV